MQPASADAACPSPLPDHPTGAASPGTRREELTHRLLRAPSAHGDRAQLRPLRDADLPAVHGPRPRRHPLPRLCTDAPAADVRAGDDPLPPCRRRRDPRGGAVRRHRRVPVAAVAVRGPAPPGPGARRGRRSRLRRRGRARPGTPLPCPRTPARQPSRSIATSASSSPMQTALTNPMRISSLRTNGESRSTCRAGRSLAAAARVLCPWGAAAPGAARAAASGTRGRWMRRLRVRLLRGRCGIVAPSASVPAPRAWVNRHRD